MKKLSFRLGLIIVLLAIPAAGLVMWLFLYPTPLTRVYAETFKEWWTAFKVGGL